MQLVKKLQVNLWFVSQEGGRVPFQLVICRAHHPTIQVPIKAPQAMTAAREMHDLSFCTTFTCCNRHKHCFIQRGCQRSIQGDVNGAFSPLGCGSGTSQRGAGGCRLFLQSESSGIANVTCTPIHW